MDLPKAPTSELLNVQNKIMHEGNKIEVPLDFHGEQQKDFDSFALK